jgi:hypothetical protein
MATIIVMLIGVLIIVNRSFHARHIAEEKSNGCDPAHRPRCPKYRDEERVALAHS